MLSYKAPKATLQQILKSDHRFSTEENNAHVRRVIQRLSNCRTASMGYHVYRCNDDACGHIKYQYHSCRDRHCPNCGAVKQQQWIAARMQELLPIKYYHVVFTLPHELNSLLLGNRKELYKLLFSASSDTLLRFASDRVYLGAVPGILSVLHSWGQQLSFHPHVHCIVSGGGIKEGNNWVSSKRDGYNFLFPVKAMSIVYRAKFLQALQLLIDQGAITSKEQMDTTQLINKLYKKDWVVYAKAPFGGPSAVLAYLGRYTHKVAISNHRIIAIKDDTVSFGYKDYADSSKQKQMVLTKQEFIRRFKQHILPKGFTKIRSYGYLSNRNRHQRINEVLKQMKLPQHKGMIKVPIAIHLLEQYGINVKQCPCCQKNTMELQVIYQPWKKGDDG